MSVIVHDDMPIELALRLLWREATTREGIIEKLQENRYYVPETAKKHAKRRLWMKTKKRRRSAARRKKN
jgi:ribosomal protein S21